MVALVVESNRVVGSAWTLTISRICRPTDPSEQVGPDFSNSAVPDLFHTFRSDVRRGSGGTRRARYFVDARFTAIRLLLFSLDLGAIAVLVAGTAAAIKEQNAHVRTLVACDLDVLNRCADAVVSYTAIVEVNSMIISASLAHSEGDYGAVGIERGPNPTRPFTYSK